VSCASRGGARAAGETGAQLVERRGHQVLGRSDAARVRDQGVELAGAQLHQLLCQRPARDAELDPRVPFGHVAQQRRHQHGGGPRSHADAQCAARALAEDVGAARQLTRIAHQAAGARQHVAAQRRELDALADAVEQRRPQVVLERLDAAAQRRLGDEQALGRAAEGARFGDRDEVFRCLMFTSCFYAFNASIWHE